MKSDWDEAGLDFPSNECLESPSRHDCYDKGMTLAVLENSQSHTLA